ncbi:MAG: DUF4180 domain-containing protein [Prevotellaceae bacterium]|jgi:hypothetical protein|nr:DUF4180 domain-containing protein [Prevotellaceae bacterium]
MELKNHGNDIFEVTDDSYIYPSDALIEIFWEYGCETLILKINNLCPGFFRLSTGVAGETLQKISNYNKRLAVIGDFSKMSESFKDFMRESNRRRQVLFTDTPEKALAIFNATKLPTT